MALAILDTTPPASEQARGPERGLSSSPGRLTSSDEEAGTVTRTGTARHSQGNLRRSRRPVLTDCLLGVTRSGIISGGRRGLFNSVRRHPLPHRAGRFRCLGLVAKVPQTEPLTIGNDFG